MTSLNRAFDTAGTATLPVSRPLRSGGEGGESSAQWTGRVKWFNDLKGFGFICGDEGRDVFVHYGVIEGDGLKTLKDGELVRYTFADGPKGPRATRVVREPALQE